MRGFDIVAPILLGVTIGIMAIAFEYFLKIQPKAAFIFALLIILLVLLITGKRY